jgi:hypothetical protein
MGFFGSGIGEKENGEQMMSILRCERSGRVQDFSLTEVIVVVNLVVMGSSVRFTSQ